MQKTGNPEAISEMNKRLILDELRFNGSMSRADLARKLGLSFPAISSNVKRLIETDYIQEVGVGDNSLGRKSTLLAFKADRGYVMGIDVGRFCIRVMLTDLLGNEIMSSNSRSVLQSSGEQAIKLICEQANEILAKSGKNTQDVLCIVLGIPGIIKKDEKTFRASFTQAYSKDELFCSLRKSFGNADILVENSVKLGAIGEQWKGAAVKYKNVVFISYGVGFGAAFILDGTLVQGANGAAGEIGYMLLDPIGIRKEFDAVGLLEETLVKSKIKRYLRGDCFVEEINEMLQKYRDGDEYTKLVIDEIAMLFGMALVNICAVLNPEILIISGGLGTNIGGLFLQEWRKILQDHVPFVPELVVSQMNGLETVLGAIITGVDHIHKGEVLFASQRYLADPTI